MVQSRGRARMADSSFVVLAEQPSRPVSHFMDAERLASAVLQESLPVCICACAVGFALADSVQSLRLCHVFRPLRAQ